MRAPRLFHASGEDLGEPETVRPGETGSRQRTTAQEDPERIGPESWGPDPRRDGRPERRGDAPRRDRDAETIRSTPRRRGEDPGGGETMQGRKDPRTGLTAKQERYAQERARGKDQTAAYNAAYDDQGGTRKTRTECASRIESDRNVAARIAELGRQVQEIQLWDRAQFAAWLLQMSTDEAISPGVRSSYAKLFSEVTGARSPQTIQFTGGVGLSLQDKTEAAAAWVNQFTRQERPLDGPQSDSDPGDDEETAPEG